MTPELRVLSLADPRWEPFDPKDGKAGPVEYPDFLAGQVEWLRPFTEGALPVGDGSVGLSVCHMDGEPTPLFEDSFAEGQDVNAETEIMVLLEGEAEATLSDGRAVAVRAPAVVMIPRGASYRWRYTTRYRGVYIILW